MKQLTFLYKVWTNTKNIGYLGRFNVSRTKAVDDNKERMSLTRSAALCSLALHDFAMYR